MTPDNNMERAAYRIIILAGGILAALAGVATWLGAAAYIANICK